MIMMRIMKSTVGVCFLFFLLLEAICCEGCWKEERDALLGLHSRFDSRFGPRFYSRFDPRFGPRFYSRFESRFDPRFDSRFDLHYSWDGPDCCQWDGVMCNSSTGRVAKLHIYLSSEHRTLNYSDFVVFKDLKNLNLSGNFISGCAGTEAPLQNLEVLDMSDNYLHNAAAILSCLDGLSSLKSLYLSDNRFNASSFHAFETLSSKLRNLEVLDISGNPLTNDILPSLGGFTSLKELHLAGTYLDSDLHIQGLCSSLRNLEILDLSRNNFNNTDITSVHSGLSSLKSLDLSNCQLISRSIFSLCSSLRNLEILDLSSNNFNNIDITSVLSGLSSLKSLDLSNCQLISRSIFNISRFTSLEILDLSHNKLDESIQWHQGLCSSLRNLEILDLSSNNFNNTDITSVLSGLSSLKSLDLSNCQLTSRSIFNISRFTSLEILDLSYNKLDESIQWHQDFHDLSNLEHLILDYNNLENEFLKNIGELTSLKVLSLQQCDINGTLPPTDWFKLKKLEELDLSGNQFEGPLPSSFVNMTSLRKLEISENHFIGNFDSNLASLTSLEYFGFIGNQFEVPVSFTPFANLSKIKFIYGEGNKVVLDSHHSLQTWIPKFKLQELIVSSTTATKSLPLPNFLLYQNNLTNIDLSGWKLEGDFPHWLLENNTKITNALFRNCSFTGTFQLPMRPLPNIQTIDVSDNTVNGQIPSNNISSIYPNLQYLNLSGNNIQGSIPSELGQMSLLYSLDLSENQLSGKIPENIFADGHLLRFLKLSNNMLEGPIFNIPHGLETLLLSHNRFTGRLPSNIFNSSVVLLDVSNNHLVGKLPSYVKKFSTLQGLYMSNNHFEGSIPIELAEAENLSHLDLSQNNLTGHVPSFANSNLQFIHLNNNHLSGLSKRMFNENSSLVMLDLSYNEISGKIQDMIQDISNTRLIFLLLKGNHFIGDIPKQLCQLTDLSILDLSHNNFSGAIPNCLGKMPFEVKDPAELLQYFHGWISVYSRAAWTGYAQLPNVQEKTNFTAKKRTDTYMGSILVYMSGIDLSHNKLNGNIPSELGNLTKIRTLNLSHNDLTGQIPATFSHLVQTESLDISFNMLNGQIPPQLTTLTSLEVFSVAHNNLSGPTPEFKEQFSTFDESSYEGNPFLCGLPLPKSCNPPPIVIPNDSDTDEHYDTLVDMNFFYVSFVVSYTSALLVTATALYINPYWRQAWFYYMELVSMNCYYFIMDNCSKVFKI